MFLQPSDTRFIGMHTEQAGKNQEAGSLVQMQRVRLHTPWLALTGTEKYFFFWQAEAHTEQDKHTDKED